MALRSIPVDPRGHFLGWGNPASPLPWGGRTRPEPHEIRAALRAQQRAAQRGERRFQRGVQIEREYSRSLRVYAKQLVRIVEALMPAELSEGSAALGAITAAIQRYSEGSEDWARAV